MLVEYFHAGGPIMWAILATWIVVLAAVLDRLIYALGRVGRRPIQSVRHALASGAVQTARADLERERLRADRGLARIDSVSQIAVSLGLFGTVVGIAQSFFSRGGELDLAAPEVLASGLSTALFTTIAGLIVFLFGQGFLIAFDEWQAFCERDLDDAWAGVGVEPEP
jgi:biopolymer transport protein ExbB/TolQ